MVSSQWFTAVILTVGLSLATAQATQLNFADSLVEQAIG